MSSHCSCEVCAASGMDTVSCAEDGSVMAWSGTDGLQYIPHPNTVWYGIPFKDKIAERMKHDGSAPLCLGVWLAFLTRTETF